MQSNADLTVVSASQVLERLSMGEHIQGLRITGLLDLDPLVVSRWLCGEDMRGIYQPIVLHHCVIDGVDIEGRTCYELVELVDCRIGAAYFARAYFYSSLLIESCVFESDLQGGGIQSDGRVVVHKTVFGGWAGFDGADLRGRVDILEDSFLGGTDLVHVLASDSRTRLGSEIRLAGSRFRASDVPADLQATRLGIVRLGESGLPVH